MSVYRPLVIALGRLLRIGTSDVLDLSNPVNAQTGTTYTFALTDNSSPVTFTNSSPVLVTVPANGSVAIPVGTEIEGIQGGAGQVTFAAGVGVTLNSASGNLSISAQGGKVKLRKTATNTWYLSGDITPTSNILDANNSVVTISGTSKTTLYSFTLPANALGTSKTCRIELAGEHQRSGTGGTVAIEVKLGSTVLFADTSATITAVASLLHAWFLSIDLSAVAATNAQFCSGNFTMGQAAGPPTSGTAGDAATIPTSSTGFVMPFTGTATEDQTTNLTFTVSITMNTSSTTLTFIKRKAIAYMLGAGSKGDTGATGPSGAGTGVVPSGTAQTGTTYTTSSSDVDHETLLTNASAITVTVDSASMTAGQCAAYRQGGAGQVTFSPGSGVTLRGASLVTRAQWSPVVLRCDSTGVFYLDGDTA